jgi:PAS domain S-box-containing protein
VNANASPRLDVATPGWEQLFRLVFDRTSNPIFVLDDQRRITGVNHAALSLLGRSRNDLLGTSMLETMRPADRSEALRNWQAFRVSGEYFGRRVLVRANGSEVQIDFAARLAHIRGQRVAVYVALPSRRSGPTGSSALAGQLLLTAREREVITYVALGYESDQIAETLHISPTTVRTHVRNAMVKLGAHTRAQLVAIVLSTDDAVHATVVERDFGLDASSFSEPGPVTTE